MKAPNMPDMRGKLSTRGDIRPPFTCDDLRAGPYAFIGPEKKIQQYVDILKLY